MDLHEAYRILGISNTDTPNMRKRKYRRLMMLHHPDTAGDRDIRMSQQINAAYEYLKTHAEELSADESSVGWDAQINENAFCDRAVFVDYSFLDKRIPIRQMAAGKYLWDPYLEEFPMLARSVALETAGLIQEYGCEGAEASLFHLLMQDYVEPISCARKMADSLETENGTVCLFSGAVGIADTGLLSEIRRKERGSELFAMPREPRIAICDETGTVYGDLSYDEDSLYYVVNPILAMNDDRIAVELRAGELHTGRRDLKHIGKLDVTIRIEMEKSLNGTVESHRSEIQSLLTP